MHHMTGRLRLVGNVAAFNRYTQLALLVACIDYLIDSKSIFCSELPLCSNRVVTVTSFQYIVDICTRALLWHGLMIVTKSINSASSLSISVTDMKLELGDKIATWITAVSDVEDSLNTWKPCS